MFNVYYNNYLLENNKCVYRVSREDLPIAISPEIMDKS